jgi:hypothetical protein
MDLTIGIGAVNGSVAPNAVALRVDFAFNPALFSALTDIVDVHEGSTDLTGNQVAQFVGATVAAQNVSTASVYVLQPRAAISYRSHKASGQLFALNYAILTECPTGYRASGAACTLIIPEYSLSSPLQAVVYAFSGIIAALVLFVASVVVYNRDTVIIRASAFPFCMATLLFVLGIDVAGIFYAMSPSNGDGVCHARAWVTGLSVVGVLASVLTKANRIRRIFGNTTFGEKVQLNSQLMLIVSVQSALELALLIAYSGKPLTYSELVSGSGTTSGTLVWQCASLSEGGGSFTAWLIVQFLYVGSFLIFGMYIS